MDTQLMSVDSPPEAQNDGPVERLALDLTSPWWGEHRSRYCFARPHARGKRVLDIACGTGFGCEMLAQGGATEVVGVDVDTAALAAAQQGIRSQSVTFLLANGTALPFESGRFDLVTSFETLEHIPENQKFVSELRRILAPSGTLILSTPNVLVTARYPRNPFHVHEFRPDELNLLLRQHFARVEMFGQHLAPSYRVMPFLPGKEKPNGAGDRFRLLAWKVANRLPYNVKNRLARAFTGRDFYPAETDFEFRQEIGEAPVMVAVCHVG